MKPRFMAPTSTSRDSMDSSIRKRNRFPFGIPGQDFHVFPFLEFMQKQIRFARCCQLPGVGFLITRPNECGAPNLLHLWLHLSGTVAAIILQPRKQSLRFIAGQIQIVLNFFVSSALSSPRILDAGCQKLETHIRNFTIAGKLLLVCKYTVPNRGEGK